MVTATDEQLRTRTLALVAGTPSPSRRRWQWRSLLLHALAGASALAVFAVAGGVRPHARPPSLMVATAAGSAVIAVAGLLLALRRGGSMLGRSRGVLVAAIVLLPLALVAWRLGVSARYPGMTAAWPGRPGLRCLRLTLAAGLLPLMLALAARRGTDPVHPGTAGAAIGAAWGLAGASLVDLWCPVAHPTHLLIGHLLPVALLAVAGAVAGARLLDVRPRALRS
jgi:hypothetical protein